MTGRHENTKYAIIRGMLHPTQGATMTVTTCPVCDEVRCRCHEGETSKPSLLHPAAVEQIRREREREARRVATEEADRLADKRADERDPFLADYPEDR